MNETTTDNSSIESNANQSGTEPESGSNSGVGRSTDVWELLAWGALAICSLLAVFALIQFYGSVTDAIDLWVEPRHRPLIHAAFNLVVLCGSLIGISVLVRELS